MSMNYPRTPATVFCHPMAAEDILPGDYIVKGTEEYRVDEVRTFPPHDTIQFLTRMVGGGRVVFAARTHHTFQVDDLDRFIKETPV